AGWVKNASGDLVSQATGEPFVFELSGTLSGRADTTMPPIANTWKATGAQITINIVPPERATDLEVRATFSGAQAMGNQNEQFPAYLFDSRQIAGPENRWTGANRTGYANPVVDDLYDRLRVTIEPDARVSLVRSLLQELLGDVAFIPLYASYQPSLVRQGVHGVPGIANSTNTWNIIQWTKD